MGLFKSNDPTIAKRNAVDDKKAERAKFMALLTEAQNRHIVKQNEAQAVSDAGGDHAALNRATGDEDIALANAQHRQETITRCDAEIAALEADLARAVEIKMRADTVATVDAILTDFETFIAKLSAVLAEGEPVVKQLGAFAPEMMSLHTFIVSTLAQTPDATSLGCRLGQDYANAVKAGSVPAGLKTPPVPAPKVVRKVVTEPPRQIMFALRDLRWVDDDGEQQLGARFSDIYLPPRLVARALQAGVAVKIDHELRKRNKGAPVKHPEPKHAFDLDAAGTSPQIEPIKSSPPQFQVVDRGPPIQIPLRVATRSESL